MAVIIAGKPVFVTWVDTKGILNGTYDIYLRTATIGVDYAVTLSADNVSFTNGELGRVYTFATPGLRELYLVGNTTASAQYNVGMFGKVSLTVFPSIPTADNDSELVDKLVEVGVSKNIPLGNVKVSTAQSAYLFVQSSASTDDPGGRLIRGGNVSLSDDDNGNNITFNGFLVNTPGIHRISLISITTNQTLLSTCVLAVDNSTDITVHI